MNYVYEVIKFMTNAPYLNDTIIENIDASFEALKAGKCNKLMMDFSNAVSLYVQMKVEDCKRFASFLLCNGYPIDYQIVNEHYYLPFRYSRNPLADKRLLEHVFGVDDLRMDQAVLGLLGMVYPVNENQELLNRINFFFNGDSIYPVTFESINNAPRMGKLGHMPISSEQIIQEFMAVRNYPEHPDFNKLLGNYGELIMYSHLLNKYDDTQILWVSRDLGDGFGYDIAVYEIEKNYCKLYEVKSSINNVGCSTITLTHNEQRTCDAANSYDNEEYHIVRIYIGDHIKMVDIDQKNGRTIDLMNPDKQKVLIKEQNSRYTII